MSPEYADVLTELLPDPWTQQRHDIWIQALGPDGSRRVAQRFKIHLSCTPSRL
jgi:hypothetical protein